MKQTWRWFGPNDSVSLRDVQQAGATGIVTALHEVPNGSVWSCEAIRERQDLVRGVAAQAPTGLEWEVVESLPVTEDVKRQSGDWKT
ncbi:MAG: mannonate dehydratase, partial [Paracoccaceae bacterium]|nr:mannonate dehydratase [Paracoccaceae bacterium]